MTNATRLHKRTDTPGHSRSCVRAHAVDGSTTGADAWEAFARAVGTYGIPAWLLSDNGPPFTSKLFTENLAALQVNTTNSRPFHPQTCGKVERFHQTLKKWLAARPKPDTVTELQHLLDTFVDRYNNHRPHRGIDRRIPADVYATAPRTGPDAYSALDTTTLHHNTVDRNGRVEIPGPVTITVGATYAGEIATTIRTGNHAHIFINHQLARNLTIDPARRSHPLYLRPGRPT